MTSVHDEPDFARVYDEDEILVIRKGDLRALLDLATGSLDFGSGFWDEEQTEIAWKAADLLDVEREKVTPRNMYRLLPHRHDWKLWTWDRYDQVHWTCTYCGRDNDDLPVPADPHLQHVLAGFCPSLGPNGEFCHYVAHNWPDPTHSSTGNTAVAVKWTD